jgi:hypothetical protein
MDPKERERLLYRRQYLYGPKVSEFPKWNHFKLTNGSELAVHPDLDCTEYRDGSFSLVLLGYILDPYAPEKLNLDILKDLAVQKADPGKILDALDPYGGRYVLLILGEHSQYAVDDGGGLRALHFYRDAQGGMWLTAQPGVFADKFNLQYDPEASAFLESETIKKYCEPWWPGTSSPFKEVSHLLPNHVLDLDSGEVRRFWPREPIKKFSLADAVKISAAILRGLMKSANNRFKMVIGMTSGYDSRIVLAACKEIMGSMRTYTMLYRKMSTDSKDSVLINQLTEYVKVPHIFFDCRQPVPDDFHDLYSHNIEKSYQNYEPIVSGRFHNLDQDLVVVKSVTDEVVRCFYYRDGVYPFNKINVDLLCQISKLGDHPFVRRNFADWLEEAEPVARCGYKVLDFFYWENRNSNWQAMSQVEFDLTHEEFTPFGNRLMLATMLGVNHKYRCMPENIMQREMIKASWPELDQYPYNPDRKKIIRKPAYEGWWMTVGRWIKFRILRIR